MIVCHVETALSPNILTWHAHHLLRSFANLTAIFSYLTAFGKQNLMGVCFNLGTSANHCKIVCMGIFVYNYITRFNCFSKNRVRPVTWWCKLSWLQNQCGFKVRQLNQPIFQRNKSITLTSLLISVAMMGTYGIQTQTPHEVEPVQIWPPKELVKVYEHLGLSKRLGLEVRILQSCKIPFIWQFYLKNRVDRRVQLEL